MQSMRFQLLLRCLSKAPIQSTNACAGFGDGVKASGCCDGKLVQAVGYRKRYMSSSSGPTIPGSSTDAEDLIASLPLTRYLRSQSSRDSLFPHDYRESRLHGNMHPSIGSTHFVTGSLIGTNKLPIDPWYYIRSEPQVSSICLLYIGPNLCGHPGYVHGGAAIALFDDVFARCAGTILPSGVGMTAYLNMDFKKPALPNRVYTMRAEVQETKGRKVWLKGWMRSLPLFKAEDMANEPVTTGGQVSGVEERGTIVAEANALFVEPKFADVCLFAYTVHLHCSLTLTLVHNHADSYSQWYRCFTISRY